MATTACGCAVSDNVRDYAQSSSLLDPLLASLAREIANDIYTVDQVLVKFQISQMQWENIQANRRFQDLLLEAVREVNSTSGAKQRIAMKAMFSLEMALPHLFQRMTDPNVPLTQQVDMAKLMGQWAGLGAAENQGAGAAGGSGFQLRIFLGDKPVVIEGSSEPVMPAGPVIDIA